LITLALAVFGCTLALAFSVRATKVHEVLMAVYGIEAVWVLGPLIWFLFEETDLLPGVPWWYTSINPFVLAWAPYAWPNFLSAELLAVVLGGTLVTFDRCMGRASERPRRAPRPPRRATVRRGPHVLATEVHKPIVAKLGA